MHYVIWTGGQISKLVLNICDDFIYREKIVTFLINKRLFAFLLVTVTVDKHKASQFLDFQFKGNIATIYFETYFS